MSLFGIQNDQVAENYYDFSPAQFQSYETEVVPKLHCTFIYDRKQNKAITRKLSKANIIKLSKAYIRKISKANIRKLSKANIRKLSKANMLKIQS